MTWRQINSASSNWSSINGFANSVHHLVTGVSPCSKVLRNGIDWPGPAQMQESGPRGNREPPHDALPLAERLRAQVVVVCLLVSAGCVSRQQP